MQKGLSIGLLALLLCASMGLAMTAAPTAHVVMQSYYPKGLNVSVSCNTQGWNPTSYSWAFNDGTKDINIKDKAVYHTYQRPGDYMIVCTAQGNGHSSTGKLLVKVR